MIDGDATVPQVELCSKTPQMLRLTSPKRIIRCHSEILTPVFFCSVCFMTLPGLIAISAWTGAPLAPARWNFQRVGDRGTQHISNSHQISCFSITEIPPETDHVFPHWRSGLISGASFPANLDSDSLGISGSAAPQPFLTYSLTGAHKSTQVGPGVEGNSINLEGVIYLILIIYG